MNVGVAAQVHVGDERGDEPAALRPAAAAKAAAGGGRRGDLPQQDHEVLPADPPHARLHYHAPSAMHAVCSLLPGEARPPAVQCSTVSACHLRLAVLWLIRILVALATHYMHRDPAV